MEYKPTEEEELIALIRNKLQAATTCLDFIKNGTMPSDLLIDIGRKDLRLIPDILEESLNKMNGDKSQ